MSDRQRPHLVVHLDEIEKVPGPDTLTWLPVRASLGIRAFGTNAYVAAEAGSDVVEPHTEETEGEEPGHEELYFVARGTARFTIDGDEFDAAAGTYVFLPDPAAHRHAVAVEPETTVLSFGGPPAFEPSAWEWSFRAAPILASDPARAREILADGLSLYPENPGLHYRLACLEALEGNSEEALRDLKVAIDGDREAIAAAREEPELESLRGDPEFKRLVEG